MHNEQEANHEELEFKADTSNNEKELQDIANQIQEEQQADNTVENGSQEDKLKEELALIQDKYLRLYSEFDNYKRRTSKERADLFKTANQETLLAMLPVLDDFERALAAMPDDAAIATTKEGVMLIYNKLKNTLTQKGLIEMEAMGKAFDPDFHEAITKIPAPSEDMKDKIVAVLEKGYFLHEKVIRFAKVVIGE